MTSVRNAAPLLLALALLGGASGAQAQERPQGVAGRVLGETSPLGAAGVYAYQLADLSLRKVLTDAQGNFLFQQLPAGLYKVIAHKPGFTPVVVMVTRTAANTYQFLELQLAPQPKGAKAKDDFWSLRERIPGDVLRDIEQDEADRFQIASRTGRTDIPADLTLARFQTDFQAMTGVDQISEAGEGQMASGGVGFAGQFGEVQVGLRGHFRQFTAGNATDITAGRMSADGAASTLSLDVEGDESHISVTSLSNRLITRERGMDNPIAFDHYQVNWTQGVGENGRSDFAAQYTEENNFHRQGPIDPLNIPEASRSWRVEGAYTASLGEGNTLQAGLRYRERQFGLSPVNRREDLPGEASVDLFSHGGVRVRPAFLVEYGLYSTLSDGSLSLSPKGGIVLQVNNNWQVEANASQRVYQDAPIDRTFFPSLFEETDLCEQGTESCYQLHFVRKGGDDNLFSLGAIHKTIGETLRVYFSDDFFDRLESLYLVPGDQMPELKMVLNRRLSPQVLTSLQSSVSFGGGGTFVAADRKPYENQIHYVVTSLDTQFQSTATGVFVALHHLSQELEPLSGPDRSSPQMEFDRLRLELTQDLNILFDLAAQWAVQLNMEVSRGPVSSDELRRRLMGGIAVKF
ncbi:MAG TPA: carboxypeptidase-like regulatory domain-containing protein [Thermoanaerobaculia bacterium]|nr:carboxypeptidase-like regulatory domain-containing protein [Thermoanaerobaculia bacterium]